MAREESARAHWTLLDVLRIFGGLVVLVVAVAWPLGLFSSTQTTRWAPAPKWRTKSYWKFLFRGSPQRTFTPESLEQAVEQGETLVGLNGRVWDVSANSAFYRNSRYSELLGRDCSALFVSGLFGQDKCSHQFPEEAQQQILSWETLYDKKYFIVGQILI